MKEKFLYIGFLGAFVLCFLTTNTLAFDNAKDTDALVGYPTRRQTTVSPPHTGIPVLGTSVGSAPTAYAPVQDVLLPVPLSADQRAVLSGSTSTSSSAAEAPAPRSTQVTERLSISQTVGSPRPMSPLPVDVATGPRASATSVGSLSDTLLGRSSPSTGASAAAIALMTVSEVVSPSAAAPASSSPASAAPTASAPSSDDMSRDDPSSAGSALPYTTRPPSYKRPVCNALCCSICKGCSWFNPKISWLECFNTTCNVCCIPGNDQVDRDQRCCDTCYICLCSRCPECTCCKSSGSQGNGGAVSNPFDSADSYASLPNNG